MAGRYELKDLLNLRASPLIQKPPNLPPVEEWMGPPESSSRRLPLRGKADDNSTASESFQKRPFLESHGRRSTTDPERIHLGPPRRSFASSTSRKLGNSDNDDRDRSINGEKSKQEGDTDNKSAERRTGLNGKFHGHTDNDSRNRRHDEENEDSRARRDADRPRWSTKDTEKAEEFSHRSTFSRDMQGRGKFEQPWSRREKGNESVDEGVRDTQAWRRPGRDRDPGLHERSEMTPEWADTIEEPDAANAHSHADFLQWMESMKGRTAGDTKQTFKADVGQEPGQGDKAQATEAQRAAPLQDASIDKFFAKFEEKKTATSDSTSSIKPVKSRFASIFGTKEETKPEPFPSTTRAAPLPETEPPATIITTTQTPDVTEKKANDEAFAKLLAMLNKNQTQGGTQPGQPPKPHSQSNAREDGHSRSQIQSPDLASLFTNAPPPQRSTGSHTPNQSLDRMIESRSPMGQSQRASTKAATEDLLMLLRRSNVDESASRPQSHQQLQHHREHRLPPGLFPPPSNPDNEAQHLPYHDHRHGQDPSFYDEHSRPYFEDPSFPNQRYRSEGEAHQTSQRSNVPNSNEIGHEIFRQNSQPQRPPPQQGINLPPGLQRPPGLEGMPRMPPGWPNQPPPTNSIPQNRQGPPPLLPPGIGPLPRGPPPFNIMQQQNFPNSGPPQQRPPQRKPTGESQSQAPPNFGGNMPPPPQPPPGFGPHAFGSPPGPGGPMPNMASRYGLGGGMNLADRERAERQGMFNDMYSGPGIGRGGVGIPPGFR